MLFDTFATTVWKPSCAKLRECTKVGYESALNCHILPQWSGRDMDAITANDIEEWLGSFNQAGAARKAWTVAALFHSTRICATFPAFTPVTLPYWLLISVWVTES